MKKTHRGCWCPECKALRRRREKAAREWFDRMNQAWPGPSDAIKLMESLLSAGDILSSTVLLL